MEDRFRFGCWNKNNQDIYSSSEVEKYKVKNKILFPVFLTSYFQIFVDASPE